MLLIVAIIAVGGFVAFGIYLYLVQDRFVFYPTREIEATPADIGLDYRDVMIEVADGERIHAWYVPAPAGSGAESDASAEHRRPTVIFCHGNGGNISHRLATIEFITKLDANIMLFDYRGYGRSGGSPSEANIYADADACYRWLLDKTNARPDRIVWFGRSLGGAVAVELATRAECAGLIVESSFTSAREMGRRMFPFFPVGLLLRYEFDSVAKIGRVNCPVLVTHSREDDIVPYSMGRRLSEPKKFLDFTGDHNARGYMAQEDYLKAVRSIIYPHGEEF